MAITITSIQELQTYLQGVLDRANHHAINVSQITLALVGAIIWRADGQISVREYGGRPANMIWFHIGDHRYVLTFNHGTQKIELKDRTQTGAIITTFDNTSSHQDVIAAFENL